MVSKKKTMIEFEMSYMDKGIFFTVRVPYSERNWWGVLRLRRARNIKLI